MTAWIILVSLIFLIAAVSHRRSRFELRIFKHIPLIDWFYGLVFPFVLFIGWAGLSHQIVLRPIVDRLPFDDFNTFIVMTLFVVYAFVGNAIHFSAKIMWRYLSKEHSATMAFRVNEMFHNKLSHYLIYVSTIVVMFLLAILELNHPLQVQLSTFTRAFLLLGGVVFGYSSARSIFYTNQWFGGYNKPISLLVFIMTLAVYLLYSGLDISFSYYPMNLFVFTIGISFLVTFLARQAFLFSRLSSRRRLTFLHRFLSV